MAGHGPESPATHISDCGLYGGGTITIYSTFSHNGVISSCGTTANLADTVAHELGHGLGLGNTTCSTYIMGPLNYNEQTGLIANRDVQANECQRAKVQNIMPPTPTPTIKFCMPTDPTCNNSPIVINRSLAPYELTGAAAGVPFDIDADGMVEQIGWTAGATSQSFLWLDRNGDGSVSNGSELFGNHTVLPNGSDATNGFAALAEFDSNGDGAIDDEDEIWPQLMLWTDTNHDGVSEPEEIEFISSSDIARIGTDYYFSLRRDRFGNLFRYRSTVWQRLGANLVPRPVYDIFFAGDGAGIKVLPGSQAGAPAYANGNMKAVVQSEFSLSSRLRL